MPLDLNTAVATELKRLDDEREHAVDASITTDGVEAEVSTEKKGWWIAAYAKKLWKGPWTAGGRVRKEF